MNLRQYFKQYEKYLVSNENLDHDSNIDWTMDQDTTW